MKINQFVILLALTFTVTGCGNEKQMPTAVADIYPTEENQSTEIPTNTATYTAIPSATSVPSNTPSP